jgi:hypothetical protein
MSRRSVYVLVMVGIVVTQCAAGQYRFFATDATINSHMLDNAVVGYDSYYGWQYGKGITHCQVRVTSGAKVDGWVGVSAYSDVTMDDGEVTRLLGNEHATLEMTGGIVDNDYGIGDFAVGTISGGLVRGGLVAQQNANVTVSGGRFGGFIGGSINFVVRDYAILNLVGTNIEATYRWSQFDSKMYDLSGVLADGTSLEGMQLEVTGNAQYNIKPVPAPASVLFFGTGMLGLILRRRACRSIMNTDC